MIKSNLSLKLKFKKSSQITLDLILFIVAFLVDRKAYFSCISICVKFIFGKSLFTSNPNIPHPEPISKTDPFMFSLDIKLYKNTVSLLNL